MNERIVIAEPKHEAVYQELVAVLKKFADKDGLTPPELLAIAANMVGKLMAMQDQRTMTPERAIKIVTANIEKGNQHAVDELKLLLVLPSMDS